MRTQTKPFIVEIKSSRRGDRRQPKTIWGNLDLTEVAGEVAEEMAAAGEPAAATPAVSEPTR